jgi:hypothetical protein
VHNDVRVIVRRHLTRSSQPERRDFVRARVEDLADSDRDIDTNVTKSRYQLGNQIKSNEGFSLPIPSASPSFNLTPKDRSDLPRRRRLLSVRGPDSDTDHPSVANLAERRSEATSYGTEVSSAGGQFVSAGGEVVRVRLVAGAGTA